MILLVLKFDASGIQPYEPAHTSYAATSRHSALSDSLFYRLRIEAAIIAQEEKKEFREFFLKICQTVLLNLLLPTLTATLGYQLRGSKDD
ncbi:hypothetical protein WJU16_24300 [Chitinophaga pollutisoli]|uniref:Uncharacterized protein n=1 Tax=Chitinophaga pollutisoli TaxID=3133966 RepID=A0ABZ2YNK6_9BACT